MYCSTSGTFFTSKDDLAEHYKSDYHRYNLKRKIADLPPVTKEWFDSRKDQLTSTAALAAQKTWVDPLTKKRFGSENTYTTYVNSKKYQDLVKKSGKPQPEPFVTIKRTAEAESEARQVNSGAEGRTHVMKEPFRGAKKGLDEDMEEGASDWETASEEEDQDMEGGLEPPEVTEWNVRRSLFDNHMSADLAGNLEYMWKKFGFYLPDAEFLQDPDGLIKYLGAKLAEGNIPLYASGLDVNAKQLGSLHAVQHHMVDTNQCKMAYDGVEEEYADYYDYTSAEDHGEGTDIVMAGGEDATAGATNGYELAVGDAGGGGGGKILGNRDFARYYRQNHRPVDGRRSTHLALVQQKYRNMGVSLLEGPGDAQAKRAVKQAQKQLKKMDRIHLRTQMRDNVNRDLPRNVPY